ncbi:MAG: NTPase [Deferribacteres bacterium]|nr:NTPase [Deferribacteres bacterium]
MTRRLFLTGRPGIGKTTVVKKTIERLSDRIVGFYTQEIRENGMRTGFEIVTTWGERFPLAHISIRGPRVSRYGVSVQALEAIIPRMDSIRTGKILVIDEIGKMELLSNRFRRWVEDVLTSQQEILATIPIKSGDMVVKTIKKRYPVWEITVENRDHIVYRIADFFLSPYPQVLNSNPAHIKGVHRTY